MRKKEYATFLWFLLKPFQFQWCGIGLGVAIQMKKIEWTDFSEETIHSMNRFLIFQNKLILGTSNHVIEFCQLSMGSNTIALIKEAQCNSIRKHFS